MTWVDWLDLLLFWFLFLPCRLLNRFGSRMIRLMAGTTSILSWIVIPRLFDLGLLIVVGVVVWGVESHLRSE